MVPIFWWMQSTPIAGEWSYDGYCFASDLFSVLHCSKQNNSDSISAVGSSCWSHSIVVMFKTEMCLLIRNFLVMTEMCSFRNWRSLIVLWYGICICYIWRNDIALSASKQPTGVFQWNLWRRLVISGRETDEVQPCSAGLAPAPLPYPLGLALL